MNLMYDTIQQQMEQISEEEQKKARAEFQMLSEQITPHFLYNTLECIHFQILRGNQQTVGAMVETILNFPAQSASELYITPQIFISITLEHDFIVVKKQELPLRVFHISGIVLYYIFLI